MARPRSKSESIYGLFAPVKCRNAGRAVDRPPVGLASIDIGHQRFLPASRRIEIGIQYAARTCELQLAGIRFNHILSGGSEVSHKTARILTNNAFQPRDSDRWWRYS